MPQSGGEKKGGQKCEAESRHNHGGQAADIKALYSNKNALWAYKQLALNLRRSTDRATTLTLPLKKSSIAAKLR